MNKNKIRDLYDTFESIMRNYEEGFMSSEEIGAVIAYETGYDVLEVLEELLEEEIK